MEKHYRGLLQEDEEGRARLMPDPHWYSPIWKSLHLATIAAGHTLVAVVLFSGGLYLHRLVVENGDELLYDRVPLRYIVDTMDLAVLGSYIVFGTRSFARAIKKEDEE